MIVQYSSIDAIVECACCNKNIYIKNKFYLDVNMDEDRKHIYYQYVIDAKNPNVISVFGKLLIVYCENCNHRSGDEFNKFCRSNLKRYECQRTTKK